MEIDFLGLGSGKEEVSSDSATKRRTMRKELSQLPAAGLGMQWSFPDKVSAIPHYLSFKAAQDDSPRRSACDHPLASSGLMSLSAADAIESNQKLHSGVLQKILDLEKQEGGQFVVTGYPMQHLDAHSVRRVHEIRKFPASNHSISFAFSDPVLQSQFAFSGLCMGGSAVNPEPLGGVPIGASFPATCSSIGTTDQSQRNASKHPEPPTQLTIFYGGSVNVFDDISPEKAQAIMFLARNGPPVTPNTTFATSQGQITMHSGGDGLMGNKAHTSQLGSGLQTLSHASSQLGGGSTITDHELMAGKAKREPAKLVTSLGSTTPTYIPAVPQARKASLARFLEKRKERMMNASPYSCIMKS